MTPEELLSQLAPVRLPRDFATFGWRDAMAIAALGIVTGLLLTPLARALTRKRISRPEAVRRTIARLREAPPQARLAGLAALVRRLSPDAPLPEDMQRALYDPDRPGDPAILEQAAMRAVRQRGAKCK